MQAYRAAGMQKPKGEITRELVGRAPVARVEGGGDAEADERRLQRAWLGLGLGLGLAIP